MYKGNSCHPFFYYLNVDVGLFFTLHTRSPFNVNLCLYISCQCSFLIFHTICKLGLFIHLFADHYILFANLGNAQMRLLSEVMTVCIFTAFTFISIVKLHSLDPILFYFLQVFVIPPLHQYNRRYFLKWKIFVHCF